jgi:hypothetical protein
MTGTVRIDYVCPVCGGRLQDVSLGSDLVPGAPFPPADPKPPSCVLIVTCDEGHKREITWEAGSPPPPQVVPLLSQVTFGESR